MLGQPHYHLPGPSSITVSGVCHQRWPQHTPLHICSERIFQMASQVCWSPLLEFTCRSPSPEVICEVLEARPALPPGQRPVPAVDLAPASHLLCCLCTLDSESLSKPTSQQGEAEGRGSQPLCSGSKGEAHTGVRSCRPAPLFC